MTDSVSSEIQKRLSQLVSEYEGNGYNVSFNPLLPELPEPLRDFRPDLVARRGNETIVVEVKFYEAVSKDKRIPQLASAIEKIPGWRLEIVFVKPRQAEPDRNPELVHLKEIMRRLSVAARFRRNKDYDLALIIMWTTLEGVLRHFAQIEGIKLHNQSPEYMLKKFVSRGLLSEGGYRSLRKSLMFRNKLVHGYKVTDLHPSHFDSMLKGMEGFLEEIKMREKGARLQKRKQ